MITLDKLQRKFLTYTRLPKAQPLFDLEISATVWIILMQFASYKI